MVSHRRRRTILTALGLYTFAALFIGYFARQCLHRQSRPARASRTSTSRWPRCRASSAQLKAERALWERRVALLRADRIDPDMLDERARALLGYVDPRDLTLR